MKRGVIRAGIVEMAAALVRAAGKRRVMIVGQGAAIAGASGCADFVPSVAADIMRQALRRSLDRNGLDRSRPVARVGARRVVRGADTYGFTIR